MTLDEIAALEQSWTGRIQVTSPGVYWDWQPFDVYRFADWLAVAMGAAPASPSFLDAGCGIGTKVLIAQQQGCAASGIDRVQEYVDEAVSLGVPAQVADCETWDYSGYDIVYLNAPEIPADREMPLESYLWSGMKPGAVLLAVNCMTAPAGWVVVSAPSFADDGCGVWVKQ